VTLSAEERQDLRQVVRDFARAEVAPRVMEYDAAEQLPLDILERMADLGFYGGTVPPELGGAGLDHVTYAGLIEEISKVDHILGVLMSMPSGLVGGGLLAYGSPDQQDTYLRPLAEGRVFGAAGVTEPQSGSDVAGMETTYRREGDDFVIDGVKTWISNLDIAAFFLTFATIDRSLRHGGVSAFIIPAGTAGVTVRPFKNKLGFRPLSTGELVLDQVRVGPEHLVGEEGDGFKVAMAAVERGRLAVASRAVGLGQACLEGAADYANDRVVFGQPIADYQMVQQKLANAAVEIEAARALVVRCAEALDRGERARLEASMAKLYASDVAQRVATDAVQIHGAYGVSGDLPVSRLYRDAKVFQIVEGANDIHRVLIADYVLGKRSA